MIPLESLQAAQVFTKEKRSDGREERAREIEGAIDWMRENDASPDDDEVIEKFSKIGTIPLSARTPEQRVKDLGDALNWVKSSNGDPLLDPSGEFSKIDSMLPKKKGLSHESHARLIEG